MRHWYLSLALALLACSGDEPKECIPGEQQGLVVCSNDGQWEKHELPMAFEVNGDCTFNPGSYVIKYQVLDSTSGCDGMESLPNEYLTLTSDSEITGDTTTPDGCTDSDPQVDGCFLAYYRDCTIPTDQGTVKLHMAMDFDFSEESGTVQATAGVYIGAALQSSCAFSQEAKMSRR